MKNKAGVDVVDDRRENVRRHIKAASDWLIKAEKSIESENDVQGDLKIMLAKAELQNAENHRKRTYLKNILPLTVAIFISLGVYLLTNWNNEPAEMAFNSKIQQVQPTEEIANINEAETQNLTPTVDMPDTPVEQAEMEIPEPIEEPLNEQKQITSFENISPIYTEPEPVFDEPVRELEIDSPRAPQQLSEVRTPPEEMQKLMLSAGQILRAE